jgi:hypothetical protein
MNFFVNISKRFCQNGLFSLSIIFCFSFSFGRFVEKMNLSFTHFLSRKEKNLFRAKKRRKKENFFIIRWKKIDNQFSQNSFFCHVESFKNLSDGNLKKKYLAWFKFKQFGILRWKKVKYRHLDISQNIISTKLVLYFFPKSWRPL